MNQKKLITILATITIIAILSVSLFFTQFSAATATTYNADKMTVNGVLASDSYVLFPYYKANLIFGFSKYGELINGEVGQANGQGLEYRGMDVFANPNVLERDWSQGWFIDIHYADENDNYKRAWAFAMYSDLSGSSGIGGVWQQGCTGEPSTTTSHGGRKTNVWATTDPIKVLYDGPRKFVALTKTTLYKASTKTSDDALVSITITFVFNKDKKVVTLFKDIKRLALGKWGRTFQIEFSNRGEWDIGTTSAPPSYAHFYSNQPTVYDYEYHDFYNATNPITGFDVVQMINKAGTYAGFAAFWPQPFGRIVQGSTDLPTSDVLTSLCTVTKNQTWLALGSPSDGNITWSNFPTWDPADPYPRGAGTWSDKPMVFKNKVLQREGASEDYVWTGGQNDKIVFTDEPQDTDYITIVYKHIKTRDDMTTEPKTPYVIGEWCFDLEDEDYKRQFRAVTVYGLTDRHDADDINAVETWSPLTANVIDSEVQYYLNETFNPYDLYSAVEKQESRWLYYDDSLAAATSYITLTEGLDDDIYQPNGYTTEPWSETTWTGYNYTLLGTATFDWKNEFEDVIDAYSKNWVAHLNSGTDEAMLKITPTGYGVNITGALNFSSIVDFGFWYYALSGAKQGPHIEFELYNSTGTGYVVLGAYANSPNAPTHPYIGTWTHYTLNDIEKFLGGGKNSDTAFYIRWCPQAVVNDDLGTNIKTYEGATNCHSWEWFQRRLGNFSVGSVGVSMRNDGLGVSQCYIDDLSIAYLNKASGIRYERVYNMEEDKLIPSDWDEYCSFSEKVLINGVLIDRNPYHLLRNYVEGGHAPYYTINFENGTINFHHYVTGTGYTTWTLPIGTHIKVLYSTIEENEKGRYEWIVVGTDAASIANVGAAYVAEAFDSKKDIAVLKTGMDIREATWGPNAPYVMSGPGTRLRSNYYDSLGRSHLRDDWCTTYPIASSDMIFIGGPRATLGTEYFNEFTNAFFAESEWVVNNTGQANKILALTCWNRTTYFNTATTGYAQISVYKDLNGTIGFLVWGLNGDDGLYAAEWFWNYPAGITCPDGTIVYSGIEYLQHENRGVTDIVLEITYPTLDPTHPTFSIVERLGTISEKTPHEDP